MRRDRAIEILSAHATELTALGVKSLALFGSVARDEAREDSDVDLLIEFEPGKLPKGLAFFGFYEQLEDWLDATVDLANPDRLHPRMESRILAEAIPILPQNENQTRVYQTPSPERSGKDWLVYIDDMLTAAAKIQRFTQSITFDFLLADEMRMAAVEGELITIGEGVDKLMKVAPEITQRYPSVPWNKIKEIGNSLMHGYYEVNWERVWGVIEDDIPTLIEQLQQILQPELLVT